MNDYVVVSKREDQFTHCTVVIYRNVKLGKYKLEIDGEISSPLSKEQLITLKDTLVNDFL